MTNPDQVNLQKGIDFCEENLVEMCEEILEWHQTAILRAGKVRELAKIFSFAGSSALSFAEDTVKTCSMKRVLETQITNWENK